MGNSTSLPYKIQDQIEYDDKSIWKLFTGAKNVIVNSFFFFHPSYY